MDNEVDVEVLRELLRYDQRSGRLIWQPRSLRWFKSGARPAYAYRDTWNERFAYKEAFCAASRDGYLRGEVLGKKLLAHRVVFAICHGAWPEADVDHIDGDRSNNRIENLRAASRAENRQNVRRSKNNTSGFVGVSYSKKFGKWVAQIMVDRKAVFLGHYDYAESAATAYRDAKQKMHTFNPCLRGE